MSDDKVVLVTGASSGIGRAIAQLLSERGLRVFGTSRHPRGDLVELDVTDEASVTAAVQSVLKQAGRLDGLINNAGYAVAGAVEETSLAEAEALFDTNFFGVLRVVRAVLPTMRQQGHGRILNVSSMAGIVPVPYRGLYAASKHALEGYTEALDHEVRQFGVRAVLIEPTFTKTEIESHRADVRESMAAYAAQKRRVTDVLLDQVEHGDDPRAVAVVAYRALTDDPPRLRYPVGGGVMLTRLRHLVPARLFDRQYRRQFHLDAAA